MLEVLYISFLAAIFNLDITAFGQFMISRPIVCGPVFGYLLGDIKSGLWMGMIVELLWIKIIPMGAAVPHDTTAITILSMVWGLNTAKDSYGALIFALMLAAPSGILSRKLDIWVRYLNVEVAHWVEKGVASGKESRINKGILIGVLLFFLKAFLFYFVLICLGNSMIPRLYSHLNVAVTNGLNLAWWLLPLTGFAVILVSFHNKFPTLIKK
ncbi:MAG: PTS sugar transporter subunit IIC [Endomicrobiales bacterium]|nr:PTS sugar transporter subunit IIC [Endomicrobiales bacterium]